MKKLKSLIIIALCAIVAALSFSGCDNIFGHDGFFGSLSGSGFCTHPDGGYLGADDATHYKICDICGKQFDTEKHTLAYGSDDRGHFEYCVWCRHRVNEQEHDYEEWHQSSNQSYRKCMGDSCNYKDVCTHEEKHYTITDEEHYFTCDKCEIEFKYKSEAHRYSAYTDITDGTHSTACVCGKPKGEVQPHVLEYKSDNGSHWQTCNCGYETEKAACEYGEYQYTKNTHYKVCAICNLHSSSQSHSMYLTPFRERKCEECDYVKQPDSLLIGTWDFSYNRTNFVLTLSSNWTYEIKYKYTGAIDGQGDFDLSKSENADGTVTGIIYLSNNMSISYKFAKGETTTFRDGYSYYYKR